MKKGLCSSNDCMSLNLIRRDAARLICGFASGSVSRSCWFRAVWSDTLEIKQCISLPECQNLVFETTVCGRYMKSPLLCGKTQGTQTTANECLCIRILPCLNSHHFIYSLWISTWHQNWPNTCNSYSTWRVCLHKRSSKINKFSTS